MTSPEFNKQLLQENGTPRKNARTEAGRKRGRYGLIHGQTGVDEQFAEPDDVSSQQDNSIRWPNDHQLQSHGWASDSSNDCFAILIRKKRGTRAYGSRSEITD